MSDKNEDGVRGIMRIRAPNNLMENRIALRMSIAQTVKNAYLKLLEENAITKEAVAKNMKEDPVVIDALLTSIDMWSFDTTADFLWGMNLHIAGIALDVTDLDDEEKGEDDENERIH